MWHGTLQYALFFPVFLSDYTKLVVSTTTTMATGSTSYTTVSTAPTVPQTDPGFSSKYLEDKNSKFRHCKEIWLKVATDFFFSYNLLYFQVLPS